MISANLAAALRLTASHRPDQTAIFWGEQEYSYRTIARNAAALGDSLRRQHQVRPGDRIALWLKNRPEFVVALFGILEAGAVAVPVNNFLKPDEVAHILGDAGVQTLITEDGMLPALPNLIQQRPGLRTLSVDSWDPPTAADDPWLQPPPDRCPGDLAVIIYTSGTTGRPKGAMLTHGNLLRNVESCRQVLQAVPFDRFVLVLPMFHSFMLCVCIFLPLIVGGSIVLIRSLHPPKMIFQEIIQHQATILPGIPQLFRALAAAHLPSKLPLRVCVSGAAPLPGEVLREFTEKLNLPLIEGYGLSEASPVVSMNPIAGPCKPGSIGLPIPDVEVSIRNEEGMPLPDRTVGELWVRGDNVMMGYWNRPEANADTLRDGWLLTGDLGYRDEDGYFFITDRKKDMLLVNGMNVYPREIEEVLHQFPGVREAAVVGHPDSRKGEQPVAFIVTADDAVLDEKALLRFALEHLAGYKVPRHVFFVPALPRTATGKVLKTSLRSWRREA